MVKQSNDNWKSKQLSLYSVLRRYSYAWTFSTLCYGTVTNVNVLFSKFHVVEQYKGAHNLDIKETGTWYIEGICKYKKILPSPRDDLVESFFTSVASASVVFGYVSTSFAHVHLQMYLFAHSSLLNS